MATQNSHVVIYFPLLKPSSFFRYAISQGLRHTVCQHWDLTLSHQCCLNTLHSTLSTSLSLKITLRFRRLSVPPGWAVSLQDGHIEKWSSSWHLWYVLLLWLGFSCLGLVLGFTGSAGMRWRPVGGDTARVWHSSLQHRPHTAGLQLGE